MTSTRLCCLCLVLGSTLAATFGAPVAQAAAGSASKPVGADKGSAGQADPWADKAAALSRALPGAETFVVHPIDPAMLGPGDAGNDRYLTAQDKLGRTVGYARDFKGPVSPSDACPCNPLDLTLVFNQDMRLKTILSPAPLQKWGHAPMTIRELERLVAIADAPANLAKAHRGEDLLDAVSGATKQEFSKSVVAQAALSTFRVAQVVRDTRAIIGGGSVGDDRQRLHDIFNTTKDPHVVVRKLAAVVPTLQDPQLQNQVYSYLVHTYAETVTTAGDPAVETALLRPGLKAQNDDQVAQACYLLLDQQKRLPFVADCIKELRQGKVAPPLMALLRGTERAVAGDAKGALRPLQEAAAIYKADAIPNLHLRLAQTAQALGRAAIACDAARGLYAAHPMLPGAYEALDTCVPPAANREQVSQPMREAVRRTLMQSRRESGPKVSALNGLKDDKDAPLQLALWEPKKVSVAIFFATWCPHCRNELPRVRDFMATVAQDTVLSQRVSLRAIRTATDRETEPYAHFTQTLKPNFPIYTDANGAAFTAFAKEQNVPMALPCVAVIDATGQVRYFLEPGDWRDTARELDWAVRSLLDDAT